MLIKLNRLDWNEQTLSKPQPPKLPPLIQMGPYLLYELVDLEPLQDDKDLKFGDDVDLDGHYLNRLLT